MDREFWNLLAAGLDKLAFDAGFFKDIDELAKIKAAHRDLEVVRIAYNTMTEMGLITEYQLAKIRAELDDKDNEAVDPA
jgi:hypothetical protein